MLISTLVVNLRVPNREPNMQLNHYLFLGGRCEEAFARYQQVLPVG